MLSLPQLLALGFLPSMTSATLRSLAEHGMTFAEIARTPVSVLASLGLKRPAIDMIALDPGRYPALADEQMHRANYVGARIMTFWDDDYPARLRQIYSPPAILYVLGSLTGQDEHSVAIVGTRGASTYGRLSAERYAGRFAESGVTVTSGLARGIDTYAHTQSLKSGGRTVAVIASGLDRIGPAIAEQLSRKIAGKGAVITEYPFGTKAMPAYFPQRNRIISGMSQGTVVIESDERGGAMITAQFALDQNREVFAVPGPVTSPKSRGTNLLIRTDRARLTQTPEDVLDSLGYHIAPSPGSGTDARIEELTVFEARVYEVLDGVPLHIDALCEITGMAPGDILVHLLTLEFKGMVRQMAGKMFLKTEC